VSAFEDEHDCARVEEEFAYARKRIAELEAQNARLRDAIRTCLGTFVNRTPALARLAEALAGKDET
jgi:hypothetical protein